MADPRIRRRKSVAEALRTAGVDALLVSHLPNIRWLSGFSGSAGYLVVTANEEVVLVTDFRYQDQAPEEVGAHAVIAIDRVNVRERLKRVIEGLRVSSLGFESHVVTVQEAERLANLLNPRMVPLAETIETLRQVKDQSEIDAIRSAAALAHRALAEVVPSIRVGESELTIAARLESALRGLGSEWHPFQTIVASGPRAALPHARSSHRPVGKGEFLLIDYGAMVGGYCSDITRMFVVGAQPDARQREVFGIVAAAERRAIADIRAGMTGREADALSRDLIVEHGFGDAFGHSLGHGVGLEVHEMPRLASTIEARLPVGAVVTIEPGIYLSGWGGVRLEDDVWLSADGPVLLSDGQTDLQVLDD